ncbi:MAG: DEAD/DEAH box helicase [Candidatus Thermoplasmatota archaeon]|nr:DEAD/DEAH box helicase [Candidatus Thermoplasmatota archaeon]
MRRIDEWGTEENAQGKLLELFKIKELYPPQKEALPLAISGKSLVLTVPTASGKSLVGYGAILKGLLQKEKSLYIVPLKALAAEKYEDLLAFEKLGAKVGISTGDYESAAEHLGRYDVLVCTSEKADSIVRHNPEWLSKIGLVVADEVHLINDPDRGPILEVTLAKLRLINPKLQIVALSATIENSEAIAGWLNAEHIKSDFRPVLLREGVYCNGFIYFSDGETRAIEKKGDELLSLISDSIEEGGQDLVFLSTRKRSESYARKMSAGMNDDRSLTEVADKIATEEAVGQRLAPCIRKGMAFHHAGLVEEQRKIVERYFKERKIKCIFATPTLAAGVNLPAKRVVVKDLYRYEGGYNAPLPVMEVKQMMGRAGRPGYDKIGEAILFSRNYNDMQRIIDEYILAPNEKIRSKLGSEGALRTHVLSSIDGSFVYDTNSLCDFVMKTLYGTTEGFDEERFTGIIEFLRKEGLIEEKKGKYRSTRFGHVTSLLYADPVSAIKIRDALKNSREKNDFAYLHLIASLPDMRRLYLTSKDYDVLAQIAEKAEVFVEEEDYEWFLCEIKTASVLHDWINEVKEKDITERYGIDPGDIRSLVNMAEWLCRCCLQIGRLFNGEHTRKLQVLERRIREGIKGELLEITRIHGVGRKRGRVLYRSDYTTLESIARAKAEDLAKLEGIGLKLARTIIEGAKRYANNNEG